MASFVPPSDMPFAVVEAKFSLEEAYVAPVTTKWLKNIVATVSPKGETLLKCTLFWPKDDKCAFDWMTKHIEPDPSDTESWLEGEEAVTIFKFCRTLADAKEGVDDAAYMSSVKTQLTLGKRPNRPNKKYIVSDSEEENSQPVTKKGKGLEKQPVMTTKPMVTTKHVANQQVKPLLRKKISPIDNREHSVTGTAPALPILSIVTKSKQQGCTDQLEVTDRNEKSSAAAESPNRKQTAIVTEQSNLKDRSTSSDIKTGDHESEVNGNATVDVDLDIEVDHLASPLVSEHEDAVESEDNEEVAAKNLKSPGENTCTPVSLNARELAKRRCENTLRGPIRALSFLSNSASPKKRRVGFSPIKEKNKSFYESLHRGQTGAVTTLAFSKAHGKVNEKLDDISARINAIYLSVCPAAATAVRENQETGGMPTLPLTSKEEMDSFQNFITIEEQRISAVVVLSAVGGTQLKEIVYGVLKSLLTNKLASGMNLEGRKRKSDEVSKVGLKSLQTYFVVHAAVMRKTRKLFARTKKDIYDAKACDALIGNWLKDAPKRLSSEQKNSTPRNVEARNDEGGSDNRN